MKYRDYFNGKKIAVIGLGPHGEMIADVKFLFKNKVDVSLYDPRNERLIEPFFLDLADTALFRYTFGHIPEDELSSYDLIILAHDIPRESKFLRKAILNNIQIEYPVTLFLKLCPPVTLIGISGPYGKSSIYELIKVILSNGLKGNEQNIIPLDPEGSSVIASLKKTKKDDVVVIKITHLILKEMSEIKISPQVALLTDRTSSDSYADPVKIFDFQTYNSYIITTDNVADSLRKENTTPPKAKILRVRYTTLPESWNVTVRTHHDKLNYAFGVEVARLFKINEDLIRSIIEKYIPLKHRVEIVKKNSNIEWCNDSFSSTLSSTISALNSIGKSKEGDRRIVLIAGGLYTGEDYFHLLPKITELVHTVVLLPGSGTIFFRKDLESLKDIKILQSRDMLDALLLAKESARKGDTVLFSPGFDVGGIWKTRKERNEAFLTTLKGL